MSTTQKVSPIIEKNVLERKKQQPAISSRALGRLFGVHHSTVSRILESQGVGQTVAESNEIAGDKWTISIPQTRIHTLEQLVEHCKIDLDIWQIERWTANKWEVGAKDDNGKIEVEPLFQVKAVLTKKQNIVDAKAEIEALKELAKKNSPNPTKTVKSKKSKHCLELVFADFHFGKLGWSEETGYENYDIKIAEKIYWQAFSSIMSRVSQFPYDRILLVVGNDLIHMDSREGKTTKGTPVSCDGRYQKVFKLVRDTMIATIEQLRKHCNTVDVYLVQGNHDSESVWSLGSSLECYFHKYTDVLIDNSPKMRKYYRYGDMLLMLTHGHTTKVSQLPLLMATENRKEFGDTYFHEVHVGHRHTKQSDLVLLRDLSEQHGVRVRTLSSLSGVDDYHADNGYVGNLRQSEAFVISKTDGIIATALYTHKESN